MANVKFDGTPLRLRIGEPHVVEVPPRVLRVRLTGFLFETDKTFLLPSAMRGIRGLVDLYSNHEGMTVVVTGHTDRVGGDSYNLGLADERARTITHYLRDESNDWLTWYSKQPFSQAWGVREDQHMLTAIAGDAGAPFYGGPVNGVRDAATVDAIRRFQASRGLDDDGQAGTETRRALVTAYMALDGTSLPVTADVQRLGCGEHHLEIPTADGVAEEKNRRAEVFLFDPGPPEPPVPARCPGSGCPYETWRERAADTFDFDHDLGALSVESQDGDGAAVGQALVTLHRGAETERDGLTAEDGRLRFDDLLPGRYTARAQKDGFEPASEEVELAGGPVDVQLVLEPIVDWSVFDFEVVAADGVPEHDV